MGKQLESRFFKDVTNKPLQEYPRPQLKRDSYMNLNGLWQYAIRPIDVEFDGKYDGDILVPFSPEAMLSGVNRTVTPDDLLYYNLEFEVEDSFISDKTILHFTAVDYACNVILNGQGVGSHTGGFYPFDLDITAAVRPGTNVLQVEVADPSNQGVGAKGKQNESPNTIWYTPQSGIWGTVWMESVSDDYISDLKITTDIDNDTVTIIPTTTAKDFTIEIYDSGKQIIKTKETTIKLTDYELWSPENPKLYDVIIKTKNDKVESYFGMRKFGIGTDENNIKRLFLNNKPYFHNGVLDQGYWSDGMLTPPTDEALLYDIKMLKDMGFNMIRKHIKIEPLRWYYYCDKIGMLVWQDMVNGGNGSYNPFCIAIIPFFNINVNDTKHYKFFGRESLDGRAEYERDLERTINLLKNQTSIAMWVPFNEGWGQFDSKRITNKIKEMDPTRTVDSSSGWHDNGNDFVSKHIYFYPIYVPRDERCYLLSEFGGYSKPTPGHMYTKALFGYHMYPTKGMLQRAYKKLFEKRIIANIPKGLSATVYTQVSDIEGEINGLITYDRKVEKFDRAFLKEINSRVHF
ncbi:MAG: glycoside hydrolase family 2 [Oscillospiraceae bacterium]|nr:glycoside hydrolase family 2 [Candidatus Limimonas egerieequi]